MNRKRCWTMIHCPLHHKCEHPHIESTQYFQPESVGEHCHQFKPLQVEYDLHEKIALMMGAHK